VASVDGRGKDAPVTARPATFSDPDRRVLVATTTAVLAIGVMSTGPSIIKRSDLAGLQLAFWRLWVAALLYYSLTVARGRPLGLRDLRLAWQGGAMFGLNIAAFFVSVKLTSAANAMVISALQPALILLVVGPLFGEWPRRSTIGWTVVAIGGVSLSVLAGAGAGTGDPVGDLWAFVAVVLFTAYYIASKRARVELDTVSYTAGMLLVAAVVLTPLAVLDADPVAWPALADWPPVLLMVALPGTGHALTNWAHAYVSLTHMSLISLLGPVFSALYAWWLIDERLAPLQVVGMGVVLGALAIVLTGEQRRRTGAAR
jgi:drug/metabolite transporter (DMT)-like permease